MKKESGGINSFQKNLTWWVLGCMLAGVLIGRRGKDYFENVFVHRFDNVTTLGLLLTLVKIANNTKGRFS